MFTQLTEDWIARRHAKHLSALRDGFISSSLRDLARQALPRFVIEPGHHDMVIAGYDLCLTISGPEARDKREISLEICRSGTSLGTLIWHGHRALPMRLPAGKPVTQAAAELISAAREAALLDQNARRQAFATPFVQRLTQCRPHAAPEPLRDALALAAA